MIDYQRFLEIMNAQNFTSKSTSNLEDNWNWPLEMIKKIKNWFKNQSIFSFLFITFLKFYFI